MSPGHEVGFDTDRKLWYCDILRDAAEADWPFVHLTLASFQPKSLDGLHISRVILAEFIQLTPDRSASIGVSGGPGSRQNGDRTARRLVFQDIVDVSSLRQPGLGRQARARMITLRRQFRP